MTVHFLREWAELVARAQTGFDMPDTNFLLKRDKRGRERCGGVPLNKKPVGPDFAQHRWQRLENARGELQRCLVFLHEIQIVVGSDGKYTQHLIEHVSMLRGDAD